MIDSFWKIEYLQVFMDYDELHNIKVLAIFP